MQKLVYVAAVTLAAGLFNAGPAQAQTTKAPRQATAAVGARSYATNPGNAKAFLSPFSTIYASLRFHDDGTTLTVRGHGGGFNPGLAYTSFFYGNGSVPSGSLACFPPTPNLLSAQQMITAYWLPQTGSYRTLYVQKTGASYVSLTQVDTFSVRYDSTPTLPLTTNLNPGRFWLNSCGSIF